LHTDRAAKRGEFDGDQRLRKAERLRKRPEYLATRKRGKRRAGRYFVVYGRPNQRDHSRLGVTASRKVGNATVRNWWKRRIREAFRRNKAEIPSGLDYVVIVKASASRPGFDDLRAELLELFARIARSYDSPRT
jgi:ribonuclease P protein component